MSEYTDIMTDTDLGDAGVPDGVAAPDQEMPAFDSSFGVHEDGYPEPVEETPVALTELSFNGTEETVIDADGDGFVDRVEIDMNGDGVADQTDADLDGDGVLESTQFDFAGDGTPDLSFHDTDGDQVQDTILTDTDGNGVMDTAEIDADNDGFTDYTLRDLDGDGDADEMATVLSDGTPVDPYVRG